MPRKVELFKEVPRTKYKGKKVVCIPWLLTS